MRAWIAIATVAGLTAGARADTADDTAIRERIDAFTAAFRAKDVDKIMALYEHSDHLVVYDVAPPRQYTGWNAYRDDFVHFFQRFRGPLTVEVSDLQISSDGTMAYATRINHVVGVMTNNSKVDNTVRVTLVFRKLGGSWLIVHEHISMPVDPATGKGDSHARP